MTPKKNDKSFYVFFAVAIYLFVVFLICHFAAIIKEQPDADVFNAISQLQDHILETPFDIVINWSYIGMATLVMAIAGLLLYVDDQRNHHDAAGIEAGSAKWNTDYKNYNKKYTSPFGKEKNDGYDNMILSQHVFLSMNTRQTRLNNNVLIIGGTGTGKSRFEVKPNLLQENCSFVVTDPKGELLESCGLALEKAGYTVKVFNTIEMQYSNCYNPFAYVHQDLDVLKMVNTLITNTTPKGSSSGDQFWVKSETALLSAICLYLFHACPPEDRNWANVIRMLEYAEVDENNPNAQSILDCMFVEFDLEVRAAYREKGIKYVPDLANRQYKIYKMAAGKTAKSILISAGVRLANFQQAEISRLTSSDDIDLTHIGDKKTALFCVISASDGTFNYLVSLLYTQLFDELYLHAQNEFHGRLPVHVRFILDEFANIGQIPDFDKKLATMRSYEISCTIILQSLGQIKSMYKDDWETLVGNCDTKIFLGGNDKTTTEYMSGVLGKATIKTMSNGRSIGGRGSSSKNFQMTGRSLLTPDEIGLLKNDYELIMIRSVRPFLDKKYDYPKHPRYKETGDANKKNFYPYRERFIEQRKARVVAAKKAAEKKRREEQEAKEREAAIRQSRIDFDTLRKPQEESMRGEQLLHSRDAYEEMESNPGRKEVLFDANYIDDFDSDFEFEDGQKLGDMDLKAALADVEVNLNEMDDAVEIAAVSGADEKSETGAEDLPNGDMDADELPDSDMDSDDAAEFDPGDEETADDDSF